ASVLITHLSEILKASAHHLLGRQEVQLLVDHLNIAHPALVAELLPDLVTLGIQARNRVKDLFVGNFTKSLITRGDIPLFLSH
ncbi:MAG: FHIPEP family type III secretion protein, partial [Verrucomicrobiales bacterium]